MPLPSSCRALLPVGFIPVTTFDPPPRLEAVKWSHTAHLLRVTLLTPPRVTGGLRAPLCMRAAQSDAAGYCSTVRAGRAESARVTVASFVFSEYFEILATFKNLYKFDLKSEKYKTNFLE
jgi:hypothetical protein